MTESSDNPAGRRENTQGPPQFPGGYPPPPQPYCGYPPSPMGPRNGLGITSLVLAIVALLTVWLVVPAIVLGLAAVIVGFLGRARVKRGTANNGAVAVAGLALGALAVIVGLAFGVIWMVLWKDVGDCMQKAGSDHTKQQQCVDQFRQQNRLSVTRTPALVP